MADSSACSLDYTAEYLKGLNYQELRIIGHGFGFGIGKKLWKAEVLVKEIMKRQANKKHETGGMDCMVENETQEEGKIRRRTYDLDPPEGAKTLQDEPKEKQKAAEVGTSKSAKRVLEAKSVVKFKGTPAPDFKQIHKKMFGRMDSLTDYADKRNKRALALGTPVPFHIRGNNLDAQASDAKIIPDFTPNVLSTKNLNLNFNTMPAVKAKPLVSSASVPGFPHKPKFDLKASLAKKARYVPHQGRLRILGGNTPTSAKKNAEGIEENRDARRSSIRGVRSNKRFELQLKMRGLI